MQIRASIIENPNFFNNFSHKNDIYTHIFMVQDHNKHIYRTSSTYMYRRAASGIPYMYSKQYKY